MVSGRVYLLPALRPLPLQIRPREPSKAATLTSKPYWLEAVVMYGVIGLGTILVILSINNDITQSTALVTMFR